MDAELEIFRALADPTRLRIFALLRAMELSVGELAQVLGQSQPRVSRHVKILVDAGLTERRKEGSWVFLGLGDPGRVQPLLNAIDGWAKDDADHWTKADIARLAVVRADRQAAAQAYFAAHAEQWDSIRSLYIDECEVEAAIRVLLGEADIGRLVDIGTGTGRMIELFGEEAIADFSSHEREELRTENAHARLGFSDRQITKWFDAAGLDTFRIEELAGGELTVKIWLGRRKANARFKGVAA